MLSNAEAQFIGGLVARGVELNLIQARFPSFTDELAAMVDVFKRAAKFELIMRTARRAGLPYTAVRDRVPAMLATWTDDDLIAEVAWDVVLAEISARRCPKCGTDPQDIMTEDMELAVDSSMKMTVEGCYGCVVAGRAERSITEDDAKLWGSHAKWTPRAEGEPLEDF